MITPPGRALAARRRRLGTCLAVMMSVAGGCAPRDRGVIEHLPDPLIHTAPPPAPSPEPASPRITVGAPQSSWVPAGGISPRWRCIVIHHSAGEHDTLESIDAAHRQRGWDETGYHFVIGNGADTPDGRVFVSSRWPKQKHGAHCKVPGNYYNEHGIGICLIGNFEHSRPTSAQMHSLAVLCRFLCDSCDIPESQILTHCGITGRTQCPGRNFSMARLHRQLDRGPYASDGH